MRISEVVFLKGVIGSEGLPRPALPAVAFFGRSNVGKSSVLNALVRRRDIARSSSRPGRTTEINYFLVDNRWHLIDLPGYGYAKLPLAKREKLRKHVLWFAGTPDETRIDLAILVVDAEIGMQDNDREVLGLLEDAGRTVIVLANKSDRGRKNDITNRIKSLRTEFPAITVIRYSAKTGEGRDELLARITDTIAR